MLPCLLLMKKAAIALREGVGGVVDLRDEKEVCVGILTFVSLRLWFIFWKENCDE